MPSHKKNAMDVSIYVHYPLQDKCEDLIVRSDIKES